jgi:hypothetical protein
MNRKLALVAGIFAVALVAASGYLVGLGSGNGAGFSIPGGISLVRPAIAQTGSFLDQEAGMSAYINVGSTINLSNARNAFRTVERENADWLIGSVPVPDHPEAEDAHVFVHTDGWIIAYYQRGSPVAQVIHWDAHASPGEHKLQQSLSTVAVHAGVPVQNVGFYDFEFPTATEWLLVIDSNDSFDLTIPSQYVVFERSYSHFVTDANDCTGSGQDFSRLTIDAVIIDSRGGCDNGTFYNTIPVTTLNPDTLHTVDWSRSGTNVSVAVSLLYIPTP